MSDHDLQHLSDTCDAATFGVNQADVFDLTYRKAGKLDAKHFATKLDLEKCGLMDAIRYDLLDGEESRRPIKTELYKLNVYGLSFSFYLRGFLIYMQIEGKDSFFKAHKDTPRSTSMFGSLVVVLPTPHEGGSLLLRHDGQEWEFDPSRAIAEKTDQHFAYIAFYSDVEHEVSLVKSGYRVTLTYNLSFDEEAVIELSKRKASRLSQ